LGDLEKAREVFMLHVERNRAWKGMGLERARKVVEGLK